MEIHSSSLFSASPRLKANPFNDDQQLLNNKESDSKLNKTKLTLPPPRKIEKTFNPHEFNQLSVNIDKQKNTSTDPRSQRAINAYIQENIQPLKNQRSGLVSKIDLFV